jgi:endonuclease G, mitochondrial
MKKYLLIGLLVGLCFGQLELPKTADKEQIINHTGFSLSFNNKYKQANWVAYELKKDELNGLFKRKNNFKKDPKLSGITASPNDYKGTKYDRGHLAPAADMAWSRLAMDESFYMSNISPQFYSFNRGAWKKLEKQVRDWAETYQSLFIVSGGILEKSLKKIGSGVSVPNKYFKVILHYNDNGMKAVGFLMPNEKLTKPIKYYATTIDYIEDLVNIDFFHELPDKIEKEIESSLDKSSWYWN